MLGWDALARGRALKFAVGGVGAAALLAIATLASPPSRGIAQPAPAPRPVRVIGALALVTQGPVAATVALPAAQILIPDAEVYLLGVNGQTADKATTQLDGAFTLVAPGAGQYRVCWTVASNKGCGKQFEVGSATTSAGIVQFRAERPVVIGTVLTGDGRACWLNDAFFGIDLATKVAVTDAGGTAAAAPVRANVRGDYALFDVAPGADTVVAQCEKAHAQAPVTVAGGAARADMTLPNHAPRLQLFASDGTKGVTQVAPGAAVKLVASAEDRDGDPVEYIWKLNGGADTIAGGAGPTQAWTLSGDPGQHTAYLMARDGKGGYAFRRFDLHAGPDQITFSGQVLNEATGGPVSGANVSVGGVQTLTTATGWFHLQTAPLAGDRYVLNIRHPNFALASRVYDRSADGNTYELIPAQVSTIPSGGPIKLVDTRSAGPCGPREATLTVAKFTRPPVQRLAQPAVLVEDGDPRSPAELKAANARLLAAAKRAEATQCDPRGAQIDIPAGGLIDTLRHPATGVIRAAITTLNPARRALPGDDGATTSGGLDAGLLSFGAVHVDLRDGAGNRLQLRPGASAAVRIPVSAADRPQAKPTIPFWSYNETTGRWVEEGSATLTNTPTGWMYVGSTTHFSVLNMDYNITDVAHATCLAVSIAPDIKAGWSNLTLRNYMTFNGAEQQVKEVALDSDDIHGIWRIPYGNPIHTTVRLELRGTFGGRETIILNNIIDTDARPHMTGSVLLPPYPYTACGAVVPLTTALGIIPNYGISDAAGRPAFLTGPYGQFNPPNGDAVANAYYAATGAEANLGNWWTDHGYAADGSGLDPTFTAADYLNFNDLGFGRDMHCTKYNGGQDLACYVTNYGLADQSLSNADDAAGHNALKRGATVVMTWDHAAAAAERVQFAVYGGGVAGSGRINFADLDGFGPKSVPNLCMVCHGGPPSSGGKSQNARFREFDLQSYRFPANRQWDYSGPDHTSLSAAELTAFARLNQMVQAAAPNEPIGRLIGAWYPGGFGGSPNPGAPTPPAGYNDTPDHQSLYQIVYGKTCRTCHVARDDGNVATADGTVAAAPLVFSSPTDLSYFGLAQTRVCGGAAPKQRVMPNSIVTYKNFWADTLRVAQFETFVGQMAGTCGS